MGAGFGSRDVASVATTWAALATAVLLVGTGASDVADLVANTTGAALGAAAATGWTWVRAALTGPEVFAAISVYSDGAEYGVESVVVRYPASFFGLRRCAFVEWRASDVEVRAGSGPACR